MSKSACQGPTHLLTKRVITLSVTGRDDYHQLPRINAPCLHRFPGLLNQDVLMCRGAGLQSCREEASSRKGTGNVETHSFWNPQMHRRNYGLSGSANVGCRNADVTMLPVPATNKHPETVCDGNTGIIPESQHKSQRN